MSSSHPLAPYLPSQSQEGVKPPPSCGQLQHQVLPHFTVSGRENLARGPPAPLLPPQSAFGKFLSSISCVEDASLCHNTNPAVTWGSSEAGAPAPGPNQSRALPKAGSIPNQRLLPGIWQLGKPLTPPHHWPRSRPKAPVIVSFLPSLLHWREHALGRMLGCPHSHQPLLLL